MNTNKNYDQETFTVPTDVMLEVAQIILQADLPHEIMGIKEHKLQIIMRLNYQPGLKFHQDADKNINDILNEYNEIRNEESESVNWRES